MDEVEILSGLFNGRTTGTPLSAIIRNKDTISAHYMPWKGLQGRAMQTFGYVRYKGFNDYRGGGHFPRSPDSTTGVAGAVAKQILEEQQIFIGAHIDSIMTSKILDLTRQI